MHDQWPLLSKDKCRTIVWNKWFVALSIRFRWEWTSLNRKDKEGQGRYRKVLTHERFECNSRWKNLPSRSQKLQDSLNTSRSQGLPSTASNLGATHERQKHQMKTCEQNWTNLLSFPDPAQTVGGSAFASRRRAQLKIASTNGTSLCFKSTCAVWGTGVILPTPEDKMDKGNSRVCLLRLLRCYLLHRVALHKSWAFLHWFLTNGGWLLVNTAPQTVGFNVS